MKPDIVLPDDTLDLKEELVPAVRNLLRRGLPENFMRACVRIGGFEPFSGGLKADLVGGLILHVNAVIKLGGVELQSHAALMNAVNAERPGTFAEVLDVVPLDETRYLLLMAQLKKHETLFDLVYGRETSLGELSRTLDKFLTSLEAVHRVPQETTPDLRRFPVTVDPYSMRIRSKLLATLNADPNLTPLLDRPGKVLRRNSPPLLLLLEGLERWLKQTMPHEQRVLIHGDPHLRNAMIRRYGKGIALRMIDPNPEHGFTDPAYDIGKILHFAEPVGWALAKPGVCRANLSTDARSWSLDASLQNVPGAAQRRQAFVERSLGKRIARSSLARTPTWQARLHVARASAHLGLLARFGDPDAREARLFVLAHAIGALADWNDAVHGYGGRG